MSWREGRHIQEPTSVVLVNNTAKTILVTVPVGQRWKLLGVRITNIDDVTRDVTVIIYKEAAKTTILRCLMLEAALAASAAEDLLWPSERIDTDDHIEASNAHEIILSAGNTIEVVWATGGASTGATDADGLVVDRLEADI